MPMPLSYRAITQPTIEPITVAQAKAHLRVDFPDDDNYIASLITAARQRVEDICNRALFNRKMVLSLDYFPYPGWDTTMGSGATDYYLRWYFRGLTIRLPIQSTVSVESITYLQNNGINPITIDPSLYIVDTISEPARISPAPGYVWPYQQNYIPGQVQVTYTAGSYEQPVSETFTVPSSETYTLAQAPALVTFTGVTDANGNPVPCTNNAGTLTFTGEAGTDVTATYTINACPQTIIWAMYLLIAHYYDHRHAVSELPLKEIPLGIDALLAHEKFETLEW